jgi:hypothetical protein
VGLLRWSVLLREDADRDDVMDVELAVRDGAVC